MKTELQAEQIEHYQREGWLIVEDFLSADELVSLNTAVDEGAATMGGDKVSGEHNEEIIERPDTYYDQIFFQRVNLWRVNDTIKRFFLDPELGRMLCRLAGIDGIRVWHDQTLQKPPWGNPTSWHMDVPNWSFHSRDSISTRIALNDATIQNGCTYYMPRSHRAGDFERKGGFDPNIGAFFDEYPEFRDVEPVAAEMKAGSVVFHNSLMAHAAGPNMTPQPRRAMTCAYMPDGATFNGIQNILSKERFESLEIGDVLDDDVQTPLVWSASRAENESPK
mgnify:FL=1|tara:strand:- start:1680 stop:2513 length:834 start_codon:yes stop_codon:yes gene_type:complete